MESSGTAPESSPFITCAFIVISGKPAEPIWVREVKFATTKHCADHVLAGLYGRPLAELHYIRSIYARFSLIAVRIFMRKREF